MIAFQSFLFAAAIDVEPKYIIAAVVFLVVVLIALLVLKQFLIICPPHKVMILSGRSRSLKEGGKVGYRVEFGGLVFRWPIIERVDEMDLTIMPIDISVSNAYSKGGISLHVQAIANVKISSETRIIKNAIERFLARDREDIIRVAKETLEGNLREVLATLTPEEVNEDRLKFAEELVRNAEDDLQKLGLHLDTLKIQHVSDANNYLNSIGRKQIALIIRDAEIAESNARREADKVAAKAKADGEVARQTAEAEIAKSANELRQLKAELDARARTEEEKTLAAAQEARAKAEQELQKIRASLENLRLQADKVIPAEAMKKARELQAKGAAASISENGKAVAQALALVSDAWVEAGEDARDLFLIQQIEKLLSIVVSTVNNIQVGEVHLIDSGKGEAIPSYVSAFPATVAAVLASLRESTGIDIPSILTGEASTAKKEVAHD